MAGVDVNVGSISFQATTNDAFFRSMASGTWETQTVHALESLVRPGSRFIDIGAWEGPVTLHAAALGASVEAYEPDPVARERLERNLAANPALRERVTVHDSALSDRNGSAALAAGHLGDSGASLVRASDDFETTSVPTVDAAEVVADIAGADMLKIDTEGGEYTIMPRMRAVLEQRRPSLLLSVHLYPFREPFARWPKVARGPMFRLRALPKQAAILRSLRFYPYRYVAAAGDWAPFRGLTVLRAFVSVDTKDFLFLTAPLPPRS